MSKERIVHCMHAEKFIQPFIDFLAENFVDFGVNHIIFITGNFEKYSIKIRSNLLWPKNGKLVFYAKLAFAMNKADKIILHSLFDMRLIVLLAMQPWLLKRCYWVIWGGDLYSYQLSKRTWVWWRNEVFRSFIIKRLGHFITHVRGDYDLVRKWYGAKGVWHECFMYLSNLYYERSEHHVRRNRINILLGNSADPSNNHIDALEKIRPYVDENIKIYCPLAYGDKKYAKKVIDYGCHIFGDKFCAINEMMSFEEYLEFLAKIDIAVFNHMRQQGMGNIISLLGLGKTIYLRTETTSWNFFNELGVVVYDSTNFNMELITIESQSNNIKIIKKYFSRDGLLTSLRGIFNHAPT